MALPVVPVLLPFLSVRTTTTVTEVPVSVNTSTTTSTTTTFLATVKTAAPTIIANVTKDKAATLKFVPKMMDARTMPFAVTEIPDASTNVMKSARKLRLVRHARTVTAIAQAFTTITSIVHRPTDQVETVTVLPLLDQRTAKEEASSRTRVLFGYT